jgi:hypothetical protein
MAYFSQQFDYKVSGFEYAPGAAAFTIRNLEYLKVPATVVAEDFLL